MKNITINSTKTFTFEICKKALIEFDCNIIESNLKTGKITARKGGNFFSFGHEIDIFIESIEVNTVEVNIFSNSVGIQIFDWGTNLENESKIIDMLKKSLL